jgi:hypothetical protein
MLTRVQGGGGGRLGYLMLVGLQGVIVADEEEAHGSYQELKQLHQGGVTPIWPHLYPSTKPVTIILSQHPKNGQPGALPPHSHLLRVMRPCIGPGRRQRMTNRSRKTRLKRERCMKVKERAMQTCSRLSIQCSPTCTRVSRPQSASNSGTSSPSCAPPPSPTSP